MSATMNNEEFNAMLSKEGITIEQICKAISYFGSYGIDKYGNGYGYGQCISHEVGFMFYFSEAEIFIYPGEESLKKIITAYVIGILKCLLPECISVSFEEGGLVVVLRFDEYLPYE